MRLVACSMRWLQWFAMCLVSCASAAPVAGPAPASARVETVRPPGAGLLTTQNSAGRTGAFFLPTGYAGRRLPLLVAIHGTGSAGAQMVALFRDAAEQQKFFVVAPDSRIAPNGQPSWEVPRVPDDVTEDLGHIQNCVAELRAMGGVLVDESRTLIAGHSGGASTAPYVASVDNLYTAFAVLHGGAFPGGLGPRFVRGWFSTGHDDAIRTPSAVKAAAQSVQKVGFDAIEFRLFPGGHELGKDEVRDLLAWWLGE